MDKKVYSLITVQWCDGPDSHMMLRMYDVTLDRARAEAAEFGYRAPKWYLPWQYITRELKITRTE